ncbi:MAG: tRNA(fMet)-specific endonuclease VapC [Sphingomonadales bacterium]|nr:tRNA(fMet)-specific endonuclease VapC [Sphingomonadales bacterium]
MALLLDTGIVVDLVNRVEATTKRVHGVDSLYLSVVSQVELETGLFMDGELDPVLRARRDAVLERVESLPFTEREVAAYAAIIAAMGFSRRLVVDRMIAATALAHGLTVATLNPRDFRAIPGLSLEDWAR